MFRPLSPNLKSSFCHLMICLLILAPLMFSLYLFFYFFGLNPDLILLKVKTSFLLHGLRTLFRFFGFGVPLLVLASIVSSVGGSIVYMMDSSDSDSGAASSSSWTRALLGSISSETETGGTSVNQGVARPVPPANPVASGEAEAGPSLS